MNRFVKQIMVAALVVTTMSAGTTTQVQAGSDFSRTLLGVAAAGLIIKEVNKDRVRKSQSFRGHEVSSPQRKRFHANRRANHLSLIHI